MAIKNYFISMKNYVIDDDFSVADWEASDQN